jgi:hypothetical protein
VKKDIKKDEWSKSIPYPSLHYPERITVPHREPPICCPSKVKDPTPKPVDRSHPKYSRGTRVCNPKDGGCGAEWTPVVKLCCIECAMGAHLRLRIPFP